MRRLTPFSQPRPVVVLLIAAALAALNSAAIADAESDVDRHWSLPLSPQGERPIGGVAELGLRPAQCGQCHEQKYEDWRSSFHAGAFSSGFAGQLVTLEPFQTRVCMQCHAPLAEQHAAFEAAMEEPMRAATKGFASDGIVCAACHMRGGRVFGPKDAAVLDSDARSGQDHDVARRGWFSGSRFCGACHQLPASQAVNGKPLMNTYEEWRESRYAAASVHCQDCHMPGRRHLWRGIHDPGMVEQGLTVRMRRDSGGARFILTNSGVGHAFPTYVTPRVEMRGVAIDVDGDPLAASAARHRIQRQVTHSAEKGWLELRDTRLMPGERAVLTVRWHGAERIRFWLTVQPDQFYGDVVFERLLASLPEDGAAQYLIAEADRRAGESAYQLFEMIVSRSESEQ